MAVALKNKMVFWQTLIKNSVVRRSPPVRGWPEERLWTPPLQYAFPACAGMARQKRISLIEKPGVPRLCGDGPQNRKTERKPRKRSPPVRGWPGVINLKDPLDFLDGFKHIEIP